MNLYAVVAQLFGNLAGLAQQFSFANDPKTFSNPEFVMAGGTSVAADAGAALIGIDRLVNLVRIRNFEQSLKTTTSLEGQLYNDSVIREYAQEIAEPGGGKKGGAPRAPTEAGSIIAWTIAIVDVLELLTGFGPPQQGDALHTGSQQFAALSGQLHSAVSGNGWQGVASQNYTDQDTVLQNLTLVLADLDIQLAAVVDDQAVWVTHVRLGFGTLKDLLAIALVVEWSLAAVNLPAAKTIARALSALALIAALSMLGTLAYLSSQHANQADTVATQYTQAAVPIQLAAAALSDTSHLQALPDSASASSATAVKSAPADVDRDNRYAAVSLVRGAGNPDDNLTQDAGNPDSTAPAAPMPTLAQVTNWSAQGTAMSGRTVRLIGQAMRRLHQPASQDRQSQAAGPAGQASAKRSAVEPVSLGDETRAKAVADVETAAASWTEGASRAPLRMLGAQRDVHPGTP